MKSQVSLSFLLQSCSARHGKEKKAKRQGGRNTAISQGRMPSWRKPCQCEHVPPRPCARQNGMVAGGGWWWIRERGRAQPAGVLQSTAAGEVGGRKSEGDTGVVYKMPAVVVQVYGMVI